MVSDNRDKSPEIEDQKISPDNMGHDDIGQGPFSEKQMRMLKLSTGIMGVMIIACVVLLGIGLSRQSAKLSSEGPAPIISLAADSAILSISADGSDGVWLHTKTGEVETIRYYKSSGKQGPHFIIERD